MKDGQIERAFTHARDRCNARFRARGSLPPGDIFQYYVEMDVWMRLCKLFKAIDLSISTDCKYVQEANSDCF